MTSSMAVTPAGGGTSRDYLDEVLSPHAADMSQVS